MGLSAHSANSRARVAAAALGSLSKGGDQMGHLARMVTHVAGDDGRFTVGLDHHTDMARRMSGAGREPEVGRDAVIHFDCPASAPMRQIEGAAFRRVLVSS